MRLLQLRLARLMKFNQIQDGAATVHHGVCDAGVFDAVQEMLENVEIPQHVVELQWSVTRCTSGDTRCTHLQQTRAQVVQQQHNVLRNFALGEISNKLQSIVVRHHETPHTTHFTSNNSFKHPLVTYISLIPILLLSAMCTRALMAEIQHSVWLLCVRLIMATSCSTQPENI